MWYRVNEMRMCNEDVYHVVYLISFICDEKSACAQIKLSYISVMLSSGSPCRSVFRFSRSTLAYNVEEGEIW